ncbi:MAG: O-succinylhomoserine sulfhydrylase [Hyphomicrobiaceae bacterium]|nr:O-succinylhomoserine sulfhydrylase [Hyphomicrobiaceae bacterium]
MSKPNLPDEILGAATLAVHGGTLRSQFMETSEALFLTQGYVYNSPEEAEERFKSESGGFIYSRYANPTLAMFEERMRLLEGAGAARATASGMAAVSGALLSFLKAGDHVVAARALFGSCLYVVQDLLPRFGVTSTLVDGRDIDAWKKAMKPNTKAVFFETPSNPCLDLVDIAAVSKIAHDAGALVVVDNVFATPCYQSPLKLGADIVVYSTTKHIDGQGRCLGGVVLGSEKFIKETFHTFYKHTGIGMSPFNAWVMLKGLETLKLRVDQQTANTAKVADALGALKNQGVTRVLYPGRSDHPQAELAKRQMQGGSTLVAFELAGGKAAAFKFLNALKIIKLSNNLGDAKSLITHPATTTHQRLKPDDRAALGITDGTVRLSVGLEDAADLVRDVQQAVKAAVA